MNDATAAKNIAMLTASGDLPIAPLYGKTAQSPSRSRQSARIERRASVEHRAPGSNTHTERLIKTAEDPLHERIPRSFAFFAVYAIYPFADRFLKLPPTQKAWLSGHFTYRTRKMRSLRRNTPYGDAHGHDARRAPLRMMFTARPQVRPRDGIPRIRARRSRRSAPCPRAISQSRTPECLP